MNNIKKFQMKALAILLVAIMIFTYGFFNTPVNATMSSPENNTEMENIFSSEELNFIENDSNLTKEGIADTVSLLDECGIEINDAEIYNDDIKLDVSILDANNTLIISSANDKMIEMEVFEGNKHDVIKIDDANNVYLDGEMIEVTEEKCVDSDEVVVNAQARYGSCPYGNANDYTYYAKNTTKNVKLAKLIARCTVAAIAIAVGVLVPGAVAAITSGAAAAIASESVLSDGDVLKIKASVYYHKTKKKFMITSSIGCQKEISSFYGTDANHRLYKKTIWLYNHVNGA